MPHLVYVSPQRRLDAFTCPHCQAYSQNLWFSVQLVLRGSVTQLTNEQFSQCTRCNEYCIWMGDTMVWPVVSLAPPADGDMPDNVREIYEEAATISALSARATAALLRLAIQELCKVIGTTSRKLDDAIGELVAKGLRETVVQSLDVVRISGNNAVHPGEIDVSQNPDLVPALFALVNLIVEQVIGEPRKVADLYSLMPEGAREAAERRNAKAQQAEE